MARLRPVGVLIAALPFAFGIIRLVETGSDDARYLWVAIASQLGAVLVSSLRGMASRRWLIHLLAAFIGSAGAAAICGLLLGVTLGPGLVVVSSAFGLCSATGTVLFWPRPTV